MKGWMIDRFQPSIGETQQIIPSFLKFCQSPIRQAQVSKIGKEVVNHGSKTSDGKKVLMATAIEPILTFEGPPKFEINEAHTEG